MNTEYDNIISLRNRDTEPAAKGNAVKKISSFGRQMLTLRDYWQVRFGDGPPADMLIIISAIGLAVCYIVAWPAMFLHSLFKALRT
jgi:hypothetical protein